MAIGARRVARSRANLTVPGFLRNWGRYGAAVRLMIILPVCGGKPGSSTVTRSPPAAEQEQCFGEVDRSGIVSVEAVDELAVVAIRTARTYSDLVRGLA